MSILAREFDPPMESVFGIQPGDITYSTMTTFRLKIDDGFCTFKSEEAAKAELKVMIEHLLTDTRASCVTVECLDTIEMPFGIVCRVFYTIDFKNAGDAVEFKLCHADDLEFVEDSV